MRTIPIVPNHGITLSLSIYSYPQVLNSTLIIQFLIKRTNVLFPFHLYLLTGTYLIHTLNFLSLASLILARPCLHLQPRRSIMQSIRGHCSKPPVSAHSPHASHNQRSPPSPRPQSGSWLLSGSWLCRLSSWPRGSDQADSGLCKFSPQHNPSGKMEFR